MTTITMSIESISSKVNIINEANTNLWIKTVTDLDMTRKGGWCLVGPFLAGRSRTFKAQGSNGDRLFYELDLGALKKEAVFVGCIDHTRRSSSSRAVFVVFPDSFKVVPMAFPNVVAAPGREGTAVLAPSCIPGTEVRFNVDSLTMQVAVFINYEIKHGVNSLFAAAQFLNERAPDGFFDGKTTTKEQLKELPVAAKKSRMSKSRLERHTQTLKTHIPIPSKKAELPDGVHYFGSIDSVKILHAKNKLRFMHVLADYENVTQDIRDFMLEQADQLEALAQAYRLVAGLGKEEESEL